MIKGMLYQFRKGKHLPGKLYNVMMFLGGYIYGYIEEQKFAFCVAREMTEEWFEKCRDADRRGLPRPRCDKAEFKKEAYQRTLVKSHWHLAQLYPNGPDEDWGL